MLKNIALGLLLGLNLLTIPVSASDEFPEPLKPHQLVSRISGFQLRDPKDGYETFSQACTRIQSVMEQAIPSQKKAKTDQPSWEWFNRSPSKSIPLEERPKSCWINWQLCYAEDIYTLVMRTIASKELDRKVVSLEPAFFEDGQTESIRNRQLFNQLIWARDLVEGFNFMLPIDEETPTADKLSNYRKAYVSVSQIHCMEQEILLAAVQSLCPYTMSEAETTLLKKRFESLSKDDMQQELEALPLILQCIKYLSEYSIRYVDLLCCREVPPIDYGRLKAMQRLQELCDFIRTKKEQKDSKI